MLSANLNGGKNAMVVLHQAMEIAAEKAEAHGFGICGTNNTSTSTGALGYYAETLAKRGPHRACLCGVSDHCRQTAPYEPAFGTNPIGVGVPTANGPVVLDMATSAYSFFGLLEARTAGKKIPAASPSTARETSPRIPTRRSTAAPSKTFDGGQELQLALIVELLAGPPVGAAVQDKMGERTGATW